MNKFFYILGLVIVVSGCATGAGNVEGSGFDDAKYTLNYNAGLNRLTSSEPSFAMEQFLKAEEYKKTPELYYSMGWACFLLKRNDLSLAYFNKSLSLDKSFSSSNVGKGIVLREEGQYDEALAEFNKALDNILFHEPETAYFNIALTYLAMKDRAGAATYLKSAIQLRPDYLSAYYQLALVYTELKRYEEAQDVVSKLLTYAPDSPEARLLLGKIYLKLGKRTSADVEFNEVIRLAPNSDYAREARDCLTGGDN